MPNVTWPAAEWAPPVVSGRAVVTGFDSGHEWMLKWWHGHYKKHNDYPVYFADFGMSPTCQSWCRDNGTLLDLRFQCGKANWFKKPFAMLACQHDEIMWIDLDCEVRLAISPLFEYASKGLAVTLDPHNKWVKSKDVVASGVVAAKHGDPIVQQWALGCANTSLRGDQEVLNQIIQQQRDKVAIMPREYQWLRLDGDNPKATIMHWTGPAGKSQIKKQITPPVQTPQTTVRPRVAVVVKRPMQIKRISHSIRRTR